MGMFDTIKCDMPIEFLGSHNRDYQTKDLDNDLSHYTIDADGWLRDSKGKIRPHTGTINFYDYQPKDQPQVEWIEFQGEFKEGKLKSLKIVELKVKSEISIKRSL